MIILLLSSIIIVLVILPEAWESMFKESEGIKSPKGEFFNV